MAKVLRKNDEVPKKIDQALVTTDEVVKGTLEVLGESTGRG